MTASTTVPARPIPAARIPADERLVWRHATSGTALADGAPMTAQEALEYAAAPRRATSGASHYVYAARNLIGWRLKSGADVRYVGEYPPPADPHAVIAQLDTLDLRLSENAAYLLVRALEACVDGGDPGPALGQLLGELAARS